MTEKKLAMYQNFRRHAFSLSPPGSRYGRAAVKQKAKKALIVLAGALPACPVGRFYVSVKRSPCAFGFCVRLVCAGCLRGKKGLLSAREGILKTALPLLMAFLTIYLIVVCVCRAVQI
jgi:hypothetical protein